MSLAGQVTLLAQRIATEFNTLRTTVAGKEPTLPTLGGATTFLRGDRTWAALFSGVAPAVLAQSSNVGAAVTLARSDHVHGITVAGQVATPTGVGQPGSPSTYPLGLSHFSSNATFAFPGGSLGNVITFRISAGRTAQVFVERTNPVGVWWRSESATDLWSAWMRMPDYDLVDLLNTTVSNHTGTLAGYETRLQALEGPQIMSVAANVAYSMANTWSVANTMAAFPSGGDPLGMWDTVADVATIPTSGWWEVDASAGWAANATGRRILVVESFTGADPGAGSATAIIRVEAGTVAATPNTPGLTGSRLVYLPAATKVRLAHYQNSGAALNSNSANQPTYLTLHRVA